MKNARIIFGDSDIQIAADGHLYLGGIVGTQAFEQPFLKCKVGEWTWS